MEWRHPKQERLTVCAECPEKTSPTRKFTLFHDTVLGAPDGRLGASTGQVEYRKRGITSAETSRDTAVRVLGIPKSKSSFGLE